MDKFEELILNSTSKEALRQYHKALYEGPDALKKAKVTVSFNDLVSIWNAGVENGLYGRKNIAKRKCWLAPDGSLYSGNAHENSAADILKNLYGEESKYAGDILEEKGFVRLTTDLMWDVRFKEGYWEEKELTQDQLDTLYEWCEFHRKKYPYTEK